MPLDMVLVDLYIDIDIDYQYLISMAAGGQYNTELRSPGRSMDLVLVFIEIS